MSRHRRLLKTKRSPQRLARTWRNRGGRRIRRALRGFNVARRVLPADPSARARLITERLQYLIGPQPQIVTCWQCSKDWPERSEGYTARPGDLPVCADEDGCNERAAEELELAGDAR
jgi:hypothetical protein